MSTTSEQRTLAIRMAEGRIPVAEALHCAMSLAEALRKLHDAGKAHGAVTPSGIVLTGHGVDLIPSLGPLATVTPYTAPEILQGQPGDARSDIFSFGAVVFEMLTGRRAFDGESQTELKLALCNAAPPPSGSPAVDRLVNSCMAKSPGARWQRMQKIIMELKLLTVAARRPDTPAAARAVSDTAFRAEIQQLEARLAIRLANYEKLIAGAEQTAAQAAESLKQQLGAVQAQLAAVEQRPVIQPVDVEALMQQIQGRVDHTIAAVTERLEAQVREQVEAANQQHAAQMRESVEAANQQHSAHLRETMEAANLQHSTEVKESVAAAQQQHASQLQETFGSLRQEVAAQVGEMVEAANQRQSEHLRETMEAANRQHFTEVKEAVDAAQQQHAAHLQEAFGSLKQEVASQVSEAVDAANSQSEQQSAGVRESLAATTREMAAQSRETAESVDRRIAAAEANMEEIRRHFATLQGNVAGDLHEFEKTVKAQGVAIESARTAMAQTDDLVERVVEALELLQSSMIDQHEVAGVN